MKNKTNFENGNLFEIIIPFGKGAGELAEEGLFDDCPLCQGLKRAVAAGQIEQVPVQVDLDEDN